MKVKHKHVYYCDHCRKHGLSRHAMEQHERRCTMNPARTCRWGGSHSFDFPRLAATLRQRAPLTKDAVDWLHDEVDGCPPCMLAALRQSGVEYHYDYSAGERIFDYDEAVKRAREDERAEFRRAVGW